MSESWTVRRAREDDERTRERVSIAALHAAGRPCGRRCCAELAAALAEDQP